MHFIASWDIKTTEPEWSKINAQLRQCLSGYSWVRPLKTLYIVKVAGTDERGVIVEALKQIARNNPKKINLLLSPLMEGGTYNGWLPVDLWEKLKKRTT